MRPSVLALAAVAAVASAIPAEAAKRRSNEITVRARSYLDAGNIVKPGSMGYRSYVNVGNSMVQPPFDANRGQFGGETLPRRWDLPNCCGTTVDIPAGPLGKR